MRSCKVDLLVGIPIPQLRIRLIDYAAVGNQPLVIKGTKRIPDRFDAWISVIGNWYSSCLVSGQTLRHSLHAVFITESATP